MTSQNKIVRTPHDSLDFERQSFKARWVFPVSGPPLENATVEVTRGRISALHATAGSGGCDLGNYAIIPGLVNAHTHLELSDVIAPLSPSQPFTAWLKEVMGHRRRRAGEIHSKVPANSNSGDLAAIALGMAECPNWGTTTIGDIAGPISSERRSEPEDSCALAPRSVSFLEILGLAPERIQAQLQRAREHLEVDSQHTQTSAAPIRMIRGLSPHAPYSVHPDLFRGLVDLAVAKRAPVAMHLAETREELQLLANGTGDFVPFLEELGVWRPDAIPHGSRPLDYLRELAHVDVALAIHGNYLALDEIDFLAAHSNISVVYCPRTHAFFRHSVHPWQMLLAKDINVALGTDSRASNPDLSIWNELLFLRKVTPDFDPAQVLKLGTWSGALALGLAHETGTLEAGKSADLAVVEFAGCHSTDPYELLFNPRNRIAGTMSSGRWIRPLN
jgi:cytosine/adenosine deaminase-related metal-dependent hydrolase